MEHNTSAQTYFARSPDELFVVLFAAIAVKLGLDKFCACTPAPSAAESAT